MYEMLFIWAFLCSTFTCWCIHSKECFLSIHWRIKIIQCLLLFLMNCRWVWRGRRFVTAENDLHTARLTEALRFWSCFASSPSAFVYTKTRLISVKYVQCVVWNPPTPTPGLCISVYEASAEDRVWLKS